ncbi:MAG: hypothetical protein H6622_13975 [Halobacteriovoraceae bacterium]|nr:hypothetical protein [Halobacteriovoraceae bacterium]
MFTDNKNLFLQTSKRSPTETSNEKHESQNEAFLYTKNSLYIKMKIISTQNNEEKWENTLENLDRFSKY